MLNVSSPVKTVVVGYKCVGVKVVPVIDQRINMPFNNNVMAELIVYERNR